MNRLGFACMENTCLQLLRDIFYLYKLWDTSEANFNNYYFFVKFRIEANIGNNFFIVKG